MPPTLFFSKTCDRDVVQQAFETYGWLSAGEMGAALGAFAPCFLWIFTRAPYVERLSSNPRLAGAFAGVTAAVVGVIFNLSLWFALHVLFGTVSATRHGPLRPWTPDPASLNVEALMLAILAALLLFRLRFGIVSTLPLTAAASLAWWFLQGAI